LYVDIVHRVIGIIDKGSSLSNNVRELHDEYFFVKSLIIEQEPFVSYIQAENFTNYASWQ